MKRIIASVAEYLRSRECIFELDDAKGVLHAGLDGECVRWRFFICEDDAGRFVMVSLVPVKATAARRSACAELLVTINAQLGLGHFDLDLNDGEITFSTAVPLSRKARLGPEIVEHVVRGHHAIVDRFMPAIAAVVCAGLPPAAALALKSEPRGHPERRAPFRLN